MQSTNGSSVNWAKVNEVYSTIRANGESGIYLAKLAKATGWSEREISNIIAPLVISGVVTSQQKRTKTKSGIRYCRVLSQTKGVHMRTFLDWLVFEQIRNNPNKTYMGLRSQIKGIPGSQLIKSLERLQNKKVIKTSPRVSVFNFEHLRYDPPSFKTIGVRL